MKNSHGRSGKNERKGHEDRGCSQPSRGHAPTAHQAHHTGHAHQGKVDNKGQHNSPSQVNPHCSITGDLFWPKTMHKNQFIVNIRTPFLNNWAEVDAVISGYGFFRHRKTYPKNTFNPVKITVIMSELLVKFSVIFFFCW